MIRNFSFNKKDLVVFIFFSSLFLTACENDTRKINEWTRNKTMTEEATDIVSYLSDHGVMKAKLTAPYMLRVLADTVYIEFPKSLHIDFYDSSKNIETKLDALYGKYFETLNKAYLRDSVVVINVKGDTLTSPDLWWDQNTKMFYTDKVAQYHTKDKQIAGGKGLQATQDLSSVIFKEPTGTVLVSDSSYQK
ncbi:MAG TPA: LPS export ABC transporter periplasmic protein LptC [Chitinophagaceae bacterium]|nr:LPS export ABC transporter periplasmic protein LptC [Chitinophagaceae bacterium]